MSNTAANQITVKFVKHTNPFNFKGVDTISIAGQRIEEMQTPIPFSEKAVEILHLTVDPEDYRTMSGVIPDVVHVSNAARGTDREFTAREFRFKDGVLEEVVTGINRKYLEQLIKEQLIKK